MRRSVLALLLAIALVLPAACGGDDDPAPRPTSSDADKARAAEAFAKVYATFRSDFAAGTALGEEDGLQNATRSVRAIRAAYFDLDATTREIDMPGDVTPDVTAMFAAIGDLIAALDKQAAATTSEDFEAASPASSAALEQADAAIQVVVDELGAGDAEPGAGISGITKQRKLTVDYVSSGAVDDAEAWVADLLAVGADNANQETPSEDMGVVVAWRAAFPEVLGDAGVVGSDREAPKNGVSGFAVRPEDTSKEAGRTNQYYLAFAARDDAGRCAGGVLSGYPDPTDERTVKMKPGSRCSGATVAAKAGY